MKKQSKALKVRKSLAKRFRVTKTGKVIAAAPKTAT